MEKLKPDTIPGLKKGDKVALALSGGLDSVTLLHYLATIVGPENVYAMSFCYNQRHDWELQCAKEQIAILNIPEENYSVIDVSFMGDIAKNVSSMVKSDIRVPDAEEVIGDPQPSSYMPFRNLIFFSMLACFAESNGCSKISLGIQETDSLNYWDTTKSFADALQKVLNLNRKNPIEILTPFVNASKAEEIELGNKLGLRYEYTWSCYNGPSEKDGAPYINRPTRVKDWVDVKPHACGICTTCKDRRNAFLQQGLVDPLPYLDEKLSRLIYLD